MGKYRVTEKVTFEYVYEIEAGTSKEARAIVEDCKISDGEAEEHNEVARKVISVKKLQGTKRTSSDGVRAYIEALTSPFKDD